ncbi:MAG: hypothetical protein EXX96DRAFT_232619 [Benjaminiella poitrasii]|nr:MAG: hypothetical protein EXX96DRAFT_232619 [Benjaminiella poitrasii]
MSTSTLVSKHFADSKSNEKRQTSVNTPLPLLLLAMKENTDSSRKRPTTRTSSNFVFVTDRARRINSGSACGTCRRRKTKCNGARPCAFCSSNHVECLDSERGITRSPKKKNHPTLFKRDLSVHSRRRNSSISSSSTSTTLSSINTIDNWNDKHHRNKEMMSISSLLSPIDTITPIDHDKRVVEHISPLVTGLYNQHSLVDSYAKENEFQRKMIPGKKKNIK